MPRKYWLLKSEPETFSFDDLLAAPDQTTCWDGVRNYRARNILRDEMQVGDLAFFYHSRADPTAIVGTVEIVRAGYPDHTAFDRKDPHYDEKSKRDAPTWFMVDVKAVKKLARPLTLDDLRAEPKLAKMELLRKGSRLSVQPVTPDEWKAIEKMK